MVMSKVASFASSWISFYGVAALRSILAGLATNSCIIRTAHDANMRDLGLIVPSDCSASRTPTEHKEAIQHIKVMTKAKIAGSASLHLRELSKI
jgi:nicotinamidase-related amidase